jgi:hypothetical protein
MALAFNNEPVLHGRRQVGKTCRILMLLGVCVLIASRAVAALTPSTWNFDNSTANPFPADILGGRFSSASLTVASPNGGTISEPASGGNPNGYLLIAGSPATKVGGSTLTFTLTASSAVQLTSLTFHFDLIGDKPPGSITWTYTGASSGSLGTENLTGAGNTWLTTGSVTLSGIAGLSAGQTINIIGTINDGQTGSHNGDIGFDNFTVNAVPEPVNIALAAFGLCVVGVGVGRRVYVWRRA